MKFTFKTEKPTGKWKSFDKPHHIIKLNKKEVGNIIHGKQFTIRLLVIKEDIMSDGNPNCEWKWITLLAENNTLEDAKFYLNQNIKQILGYWNLYSIEIK